jgi:hypothetical protein
MVVFGTLWANKHAGTLWANKRSLLKRLPVGSYASSAQLLTPVPATNNLFAPPQIVSGFQTVTLTGVCPSGTIVADPASHSWLPVLPRVSGSALTVSLTGGDIGSQAISVTFTSGSRAPEIASFRYACSQPGR